MRVRGLTDSQKAILKMIKANPYTSKKEMSENMGIRTSSIDKNIQTLKKKGLLKIIGPAKGGHWEIL
jgi:ATP-dependent DNA helicase RecG